MFSIFQLDEKIQTNEKSIKELILSFEQHESEIHDFLEEIGISFQQAEAYISDKQNFSEEEWEELQNHKNAMDEKLKRDLENIRNPLKSKKAYSERKVDKHWLFVR